MQPAPGIPTLARKALDIVRAEILACELKPGARLRMEDMRKRYQMGFSPLREALVGLQSEGLVRLDEKRGFSVARVSRLQLEDLARSRIALELLALEWSIQNGDLTWEGEIVSAFHRLTQLSKTTASDGGMRAGWAAAHRHFHRSLIEASGSPTIAALWNSLFDQYERYVALSIAAATPPRDDVREHRQLMTAVLERDIPEARRLCALHIERTKKKVLLSATFAEMAEL